MTWKPSVLVVAPTPSIATAFFAWLTDAGCTPCVVSSFADAKQLLDEQPAVLISEVRLGEYNGLHLALRAQARNVPAIIIGQPDPVLKREAAQFGAVYLSDALDAQQLVTTVEPMITAAAAKSRTSHAAAAGVWFISMPDRTRPVRPANPFRF